MTKDEKGILQRAGYIDAAIGHAARHRENAAKAREAGNITRAKQQETRANNYLNRAAQSARNIADKVRERD